MSSKRLMSWDGLLTGDDAVKPRVTCAPSVVVLDGKRVDPQTFAAEIRAREKAEVMEAGREAARRKKVAARAKLHAKP